jgi:Cd2+/Zn2+-exporting ATPase/Cu+-exporting ATPase
MAHAIRPAEATAHLSVQGLCCADEAAQVERALGSLAGVKRIQVSVAAGKTTVTFDPNLTGLAQIKDRIASAGFAVTDGRIAETSARKNIPHLISTGLIFAVALLILSGIVAERLGVVDRLIERIPTALLLAAVVIGGYPIFRNVARALIARTVTAHALMTLGILGALAIGEYGSAVLIVFFMRLADAIESFTTERSREAVRRLTALSPVTARVERDGKETEMGIESVRHGDTVVVRSGEKIPVDGRVLTGYGSVNQATITGESLPVEKGPGDDVFAATLNERGLLRIETRRVGPDTTFGHVIALVERAEAAKAPVQRFADRVTAYYIPIVLSLAGLTFFISGNAPAAVSVLVVACSCAIAMATPIAVMASVGTAARRGILIKGGLHLESLAEVDTLVMDKTGTITFGKPRIGGIYGLDGASENDLLQTAAVLERYSEHPLASAVVEEAQKRGLSIPAPDRFDVLPGEGIRGRWNGADWLLGNRKLMENHGVRLTEETNRRVSELETDGYTTMLLACGNTVDEASRRPPQMMAIIAVSDTLREEVRTGLEEIRGLGIKKMLLLTGDNRRVAAALAARLGVEYKAELLPEDKIAEVSRLQSEGRRVAMIGDGINDAPALAQADVGIAMGAAGSDTAIEAAHVALMQDNWLMVAEAIRIGRRTFRTIRQNLAFAVAYNVIGIGLAASGVLPPVWAAAAQSLPDVAVLLNSSRLLRVRPPL